MDFYGSWQDSWRAVEHDAQGRHSEFLASAFPYDAAQDRFTCPAGQTLTHHALLNRDNGVRTHVYRAPKKACPDCPLRDKCAPQQARPEWRRSITRLQEPSATTAFKQKMATEEAKQIYARRSQIAEFPHAWINAVPLQRPLESRYGSDLGLSQLQPGEMVRSKADTESTPRVGPSTEPESVRTLVMSEAEALPATGDGRLPQKLFLQAS